MDNQGPEQETEKVKYLTTPLSRRGIPPWFTYITALLGFAYILNPTWGFIELIPDNIPIIGNLDEGAAFLLIWYGLVEFFEGYGLKTPKR